MYREIGVMRKLDHPHIIKYFETYDEQGFIYLVMELCQNGSLEDKIKYGPLKEEYAAKYLYEVAKALEHCHAIDLIHRDIKPDNMMFGSDGEVKLIDFGLSLVRKGSYNKLKLAGTPYYFAPEVIDEQYGKECDIWSLGVSFYQLLSNKKEPHCFPFPATNMDDLISKIQLGKFQPLPNVSEECNNLLKQMICVDRQ